MIIDDHRGPSIASIIVGLTLLGCACAPTTPTAAKVSEPSANKPAETTPDEPSGPILLRLSPSSRPPAPWRHPPAEHVISASDLAGTFEDAAAGSSVALVRWMGGMLIVDAKTGVQGTMTLPENTVWAGVDGDDRLFVATTNGALWRANAWNEDLTRVGKIEGARGWDVAPESLVVVTDDGALRSRDGGEHFEPLPAPPRRHGTPRILTRYDGVIVVQSSRDDEPNETLVLPRGAKRWRAGPADLGPLVRTGAWIADAAPDECGRVLARDGQRWVRAQHAPSLSPWSSLTELSNDLRPVPNDPLPSLTVPAPPHSSNDCEGGAFGVGGLGTGIGEPEPIRGTSGPPPRATKHWVRLFSDAVCDRDPDSDYRCADDRPVLRLPHAALWNEHDRRLRVASLPPACTHPQSLKSAGGIGVLRCAEASAIAIWTLGADARWHAEGRLTYVDQAPGALTMARDGTLLLHGHCQVAGPCESSWLRAPEPLGKGAWVPLDATEVLAFRVLDGGRALRIGGGHDKDYVLAVVNADGAVEPLVFGVGNKRQPLSALRVADDQTLHLTFGGQEHVLDELGLLYPTPPPEIHGSWRGPTLVINDSYPNITAVGDYDDDGLDDFAVLQRNREHTHAFILIVRGSTGLASMSTDGLDDERHIRVTLDVPMYGIQDIQGVGDVNGDGHDDIAITVSTPRPHDTKTDGETYVVLGRPTTETRTLSAIRKGDGGFWIGGFPKERSYVIHTGTVGDLDGDGRSDLGLLFPSYRDDPGRLYVVLGKQGTDWVHLQDIDRGRGGFTLRGTEDELLWGPWAALGDFDGDGGDDLALTTRRDDIARVHVVRGGKDHPRTSGTLPARLVANGGLVIQAATKESLVRPLGDIDGDGHMDLAIAQPKRDGMDFAAGRVAIVYGRTHAQGSLSLPSATLDQGVTWILGSFAFDGFGRSIAPLGDHDGDGYSELAIGAPYSERYGVGSGRVYVLRGGPRRARIELREPASPSRDWVLEAVPGQLGLGQSLVSGGDLDGDGHADLLMTAARFGNDLRSPLHVVLGLPGQ